MEKTPKQTSVLSNSSPEILKPMPCKAGTLQVRWIDDDAGHGLFITFAQGTSLLATHDNGYSCHELAKRIAAGNYDRAVQQANYIMDCGGTGRRMAVIEYWAKECQQ
jgi:hypothetical protein